jgi:hypothetical protein
MTPVLDFSRDRFDLCVFLGQRADQRDKLLLEKRAHDFTVAHEVSLKIPMYPTTREKNGTLFLTAVVSLADLNRFFFPNPHLLFVDLFFF